MSYQETTLADFCTRLAARTATPGGGAVAAVTAAHAAALIGMVLEFTVGKPAFAAHEVAHRAALERAGQLRRRALQLADEDAAAYADLNALWKRPQDDPERVRRWAQVVAAAIAAPQETLDLAVELARLAASLNGCTNANLASDLAIAADLAQVAARAAAHNVAVNLPSLIDDAARAAAAARMRDALATAASFTHPQGTAAPPADRS